MQEFITGKEQSTKDSGKNQKMLDPKNKPQPLYLTAHIHTFI